MLKKKFSLIITITGIILSFFLVAEGFFQSNDESSYRPRRGGVLRIKSISDEFRQQLDPVQPGAYIFISEQIFDGLVRLDKKLNIVPELSDYWTISNDGKIYTFYLRKGIPFYNHREVLASDVKFSLERILAPETDSPFFQYFLSRVEGAAEFREGKDTEVRGFKVLDKHIFQIEWTKPYVSALYLLSMPFCKILPADMVEKQGKNFFYKPTGTGPFYFDSWVRDTRLNIVGVRLKRNDDYFLGAPYLDTIEFCPLFTLDHFLNGQIDLIPVVSEKLLDGNFQVYVDGSIQTFFLGMSCHIPPFDREEVRRAILHGIDKQQLIEAVAESRYVRKPVNSFIPSRLPGFYPTNEDAVFNLDRAV
ncbi:MAG: ABC transporter substrate-binding protein, partial [Acidobacteriota bacterium]